MCVKNLDSKYLELLTFLLNGSTASIEAWPGLDLEPLVFLGLLWWFFLHSPWAHLEPLSTSTPRSIQIHA